MNIEPALLVTLLLLALALIIWTRSREPQVPNGVRRTHTVAYTYSATATVQYNGATYLEFPSPPTIRKPVIGPTILKDFTEELSQSRSK